MRRKLPPHGKVYASGGMQAFVAYFLAGDDVTEVQQAFDPSNAPAEKDAFYVGDAPSSGAEAINFYRPRKRLWALFNRRYFEASILPLTGWIRFGAGWYGEEVARDGGRWRWMGKEGHTLLEPLGGKTRLAFNAGFPLELEAAPAVTVTFDGNIIDRFIPDRPSVERSYIVTSRRGVPDELVFAVDRSVNPARAHRSGDTRDLGMMLHRLSWKAQP
jgi:hypothetical protein